MQLVSSLGCEVTLLPLPITHVSISCMSFRVKRNCSREKRSTLSWGRKLGLPCPHIDGVSFENVNGFKKKKKKKTTSRRSVLHKCGHICLRRTGYEQHLKGFLIRHRMSHTSQRPQSIPWIITKRATPLPPSSSPLSSPPILLFMEVIFSFMCRVSYRLLW